MKKYILREYIEINDDSLEKLAKHLDITYQTLSKKMNGHVEFTRAEIKKIKDRYKLTPEQIVNIFFEE